MINKTIQLLDRIESRLNTIPTITDVRRLLPGARYPDTVLPAAFIRLSVEEFARNRVRVTVFKSQVEQQSVAPPDKAPSTPKASKKAAAVKAKQIGVNQGAINRAAAIKAARPDLAQQVVDGSGAPELVEAVDRVSAQRIPFDGYSNGIPVIRNYHCDLYP